MTGLTMPIGPRHAEAFPMTSGYFALIVRGHGTSDKRRAALLEGTGISHADLAVQTEITLGQQLRLVRNAARTLDPDWALETGAMLSAATHGLNGFALASAPTLRHGVDIMSRFAQVRSPHFRLRAYLEGPRVHLVPEDRVALSDVERCSLLDLVMLSLQGLIEVQLGRPMVEARFEFPYPAPEHARRYAELYHGSVHFDCPRAAAVIPTDWLAVENPFADPALYQTSLEQLAVSARRLGGDRRLVARVEQVLAMRGARLGLRQAARLLGVSERTLTRRLGGQGTSFQELVDHSLKSQAVALLQDSELTVAEVAYSLGYQDAANFGRAFRRWFGMSPGRYRATHEPLDAESGGYQKASGSAS